MREHTYVSIFVFIYLPTMSTATMASGISMIRLCVVILMDGGRDIVGRCEDVVDCASMGIFVTFMKAVQCRK